MASWQGSTTCRLAAPSIPGPAVFSCSCCRADASAGRERTSAENRADPHAVQVPSEATISVDAYPGSLRSGRTIVSMSPGTGSDFSVHLPPENATGNRVEVVQRLPAAS